MTKKNSLTKAITSRNDPRIRQIRNLQRQDERKRTGLYYIEGVRFVAQAIRYNAHIESLVVCLPLVKHQLAHQLVWKQAQAGTPVFEVAPEVMHSIALVDDPQGIGAVVRQKWLPLERAKLGGKLCWLALESVRSPGNLGSILRTSDAVGGAGLFLFGETADPYDPATVRASMGALFSQRFVRTSIEQFALWKEARRWMLVGTSPSAEKDYQEVRYDSPTVLLVGSERKGLSTELQALCETLVRIPMVGRADSLNAAVAASLVLYEVFNQQRRRAAITLPGE